jgi:hypothetical protein
VAWSVLQSVGAVVASGNGAATYTTNLSSGSVMICCLGVDVSRVTNPITAVKDTAGNSFTDILSVEQATDHSWTEIWALATPSGNVGTKPTITSTAAANNGVATVLLEVSGIQAVTDGTAIGKTGTGTPATGGAYSTTTSNEFLIMAYGDAGYSTTQSTPTGYAAAAGNEQNNSDAQASAWYKNSTGGAETASSTLSATSNWSTAFVAFLLSGGGAAALPLLADITRMAVRRASVY